MPSLSLAARSRHAIDARSRCGRCLTHLQHRTEAFLRRTVIARPRASSIRSNVGTPTTSSTSTSASPLSFSPPPSRSVAASASSSSVASSSTEEERPPPLNSKDIAPSSPSAPTLVLYSKKGCPLCQGLEEKVRAAFSRGAFLPGCKLKGCGLEVRDIEENEEWNARFAMEVPVLFWKTASGGGESDETPVPRSPPRVTVEKLSSTLESAMPPVG